MGLEIWAQRDLRSIFGEQGQGRVRGCRAEVEARCAPGLEHQSRAGGRAGGGAGLTAAWLMQEWAGAGVGVGGCKTRACLGGLSVTQAALVQTRKRGKAEGG